MRQTVRTLERKQLMRDEYPTAPDAAAFLARLNDLAGPPISSVHGVRVWAVQLGLRKSPETKAALLRSWSAAGGRATSRVYAGKRGDALKLRWTPERIDLMRAEYPDATDPHAFMSRLNERPGLPIKHIGAVSLKALRLGLAKTDAAKLAIGSRNGRRCVENGTLTRARTTRRTPERLALMLAGYPTADDPAAFLSSLNALAGPVIPTMKAVQSWASLLGLRKTPETAAAIRQRYSMGGRMQAVPELDQQAKREAGERRREERKQASKPVAAYIKPRAPEMRRGPIAQPVVRAPAPVADVEPSPELADAAVNRRLAAARAMLAKKAAPDIVRARTGLPLREVLRLVGEARMGVST